MHERTFEDIPAPIRTLMSSEQAAVVRHQCSRTPQAPTGNPIEDARADYRDERAWWNEGGPRMARTDDVVLTVAGSAVRVRIHRPATAELLPAIIFSHGGGFTVGDLDTHDRIQRVLAAESGAAVMGVDYSRAPEAVFPQALYEVAGVVAHVAHAGEDYGIDGTRLSLAGDSAGASLSLSAALLLRDEPEKCSTTLVAQGSASAFTSIRSLLLYYGGFGLRDSVSRRLYGGWWDGMAATDLEAFAAAYYGQRGDGPYVDMLSADYTRGVPPMFILGAQLDPLVDDSRALAGVAAQAGCEYELHIEDGALHSFLHFGRMMEASRDALAWGAEYAAARMGT